MKKLLIFGLGAFALCALIITVWLLRVLSNLPDVSVLKHYRPAAAAEVLDKDGNILTQYYDRTFRLWVPIASLPDIVIQAVVIAEDDTFFGHEGVNYKAVWEAMKHDARKGRFARGGSTITQQMIKNVLLSKEKTLSRKLREFVLARRAEDILTKRRILEIYLNEVEWGDRVYGIEAASRFYLDKHASELTAAEAALLAGMLPNPRYYNPYKRMDKAKKRQERVLFNMQQAKLITQDEYAAELRSSLNLRQEGSSRFDLSALATRNGRPCYHQALERMLVSAIGNQELYRSRAPIKTTIDKILQNELRNWEESLQERVIHPSDRVTVIKQGARIRAMVCALGREQELHSKLDFLDLTYSGYEVVVVSPDAIFREQIVQQSGGEVK